MRVILSFLLGVLVGAGGLFIYLRQIPQGTVPPVAAVTPAPAPAPAPAAGAAPLAAALPGAPVVPTDLTEADLPLHPAAQELAALPPVQAGAPARLLVPVEGVKAGQLADTFDQPRGRERHHEALDIMAPKGSKVLAAGDGKVVKLFNSKPGGLTVYQFDPAEKYAYYYAHLDRYADGVKEGSLLKRGDVVGYVGTTGNADPKTPHLHFAVVELTPQKQWWKGTPVNPYPLLGD
jgi:murein DD-endopeptidase MepM/ murein hydrolase activator NlpD